jgi:hypothetical protein
MSDEKVRRFWTYGKDQWSGPLVSLSGDEYGNSTVVFRLIGGRALIVAWNIPLRRKLEPCEGRTEWGWACPDQGELNDPIPCSGRETPPDGYYLVRREVWFDRWEKVPD